MSTNNTRQAAWVAIGSFFSMAVGIISPMILSRFFSVGDYGTYRQVMYVYTTLLIVFTLGLPKAFAYFLPRHPDGEAKAIIRKITLLFFALGTLFALVLFVGAEVIAKILGNPELAPALRAFSPVPVFLLPTMGLDGILATYRKTQFLAAYTVITKIITVAFTVLPVVLLHGNYIHSIIGFDIAAVFTFIVAFVLRSLPVKDFPRLQTSLSYRQILAFSLPLLTASLWGMLYESVNQFFISRYFGKEVFAVFSNGFAEMPFLVMVTGALSTVLLPLFSRMEKGDGLSEDMLSVWTAAVTKSAKILFPMSVFCIFMASLVMTCLYGDAYGQSAIYFQIKNLYGLFCIVPFAPVLIAMGRTRTYSNVIMFFALALTGLEFLAVSFLDSPVYIATLSAASGIAKCVVFLVIIARASSIKLSDMLPLRTMLAVLAASCIASVPVLLISGMLQWNKFVLLFLAVLLFCGVYYLLCWIFKISYKDIAGAALGQGKAGRFIVSLMP